MNNSAPTPGYNLYPYPTARPRTRNDDNYWNTRRFSPSIQIPLPVPMTGPVHASNNPEYFNSNATALAPALEYYSSQYRQSMTSHPSLNLPSYVLPYTYNQPLNYPAKKIPWNFEKIRFLSEGSFGKVYLVRERLSGFIYALKTVRKVKPERGRSGRSHAEQSFIERNILASVRHPYIVKLYYTLQDDRDLHFVFEYASGGELHTFIDNYGHLDQYGSAFYASELVLALHYLHTEFGVVHRDLKTENCLIDRDGHLLLADFGLSKILRKDQRCKSLVGTVGFIAPEILQGREYDFPSDWWSLGIVVFHLLTGHLPFKGDNWEEYLNRIWSTKFLDYPPHVPENAKDFCNKLLEPNPRRRWGANIEGVKTHPFFRNIDWKKMESRDYSLTPPIVVNSHVHSEPISVAEHLRLNAPNSNPSNSNVYSPAVDNDNSDPFRGFSFDHTRIYNNGPAHDTVYELNPKN